MTLGWSKTAGIENCEWCVDEDGYPTDLRRFPQPIVEVSDPDALRLVIGLINPDPLIRQDSLAKVDPVLMTFGPSQLFELAMRMLYVLANPMANIVSDNVVAATPDHISTVGRAFMNWSAGFDAICASLRKHMDQRPSQFGLRKEVGPLLSLTHGKYLSEDLRGLIRHSMAAGIAADGAPATVRGKYRPISFVTAIEASEILQISEKTMRRLMKHDGLFTMSSTERCPTLFRRADIEELASLKGEVVPGRRTARELGLPLEALVALGSAGLIEAVKGVVTLLVAEANQFHRSSIDQFIDKLLSTRSMKEPPPDLVALGVAMRAFSAGQKPWGGVFQALIEGSLMAYGDSPGRDLLDSILVSQSAFRDWADSAGPSAQNNIIYITARDAALELGVDRPTLWRLLKAGILRFDENARHGQPSILRSDVLKFSEHFALTREVAEHFGVHPSKLKQHMATLGIRPRAAIRNGMGFIWRRAELEGIAASNA